MTIGAYFKAEVLADALRRLCSLPKTLRPTHFGSGERKPPSSNRIESREKYEAFLRVNTSGHYLFAERCRFDVTPVFFSNYSTVFVDPSVNTFQNDETIRLVETLAVEGADFCFAAEESEYHHRNRYRGQLGDIQVEAWVGRDLAKYLPGLYWLTVLSHDLAHRSGISSSDVPSRASTREIVPGWLRIQMPGYPSDWKCWAQEIDVFCVAHLNIFSLDRIRSQLMGANRISLDSVLRKWR